MALLTPMTLTEAQALGHAFGLEVVALEPLVAGSVNSNFRVELAGGAQVFFRVCEESGFEAVASQNRLLSHLVERGVPTPAPHVRVDGKGTVAEHRSRPVACFDFLPGRSCRQSEVDEHRASTIGRQLASIHHACAGYTAAPVNRFGLSALDARLQEVQARTLTEELKRDVMRLAELVRQFEPMGLLERADQQGVIHGDLFRDNVLWTDDGAGCTLLDFESASEGNRCFDLMVTTLAWCFSDRLDERLVGALARGYDAVLPLGRGDLDSLYDHGRLAAVRFAVTRITDYELRGGDVVAYKDYRRFMARLDALQTLGRAGVAQLFSV